MQMIDLVNLSCGKEEIYQNTLELKLKQT